MKAKQCICPECGRVAEVRRQSNGQNLRYMYCKQGCGGLHTRSKADHWESIEQDEIGVLGEFPEGTKPPAEKQNEAVEQATNDKLEDFQPEPQDTPEALEGSEPAVTSQTSSAPKKVEQQEPESTKVSFGVKVALSLLTILGIAGGVKAIKNKVKAG